MELPDELFAELSEGARFEQETSPADRRKFPRVRIAIEAAIVRLGPGADASPIPVIVRDISSRGARFECRETFHIWDVFAIRFARRDGSPAWFQSEVKRWSPIAADCFSVGAQFLKMLNPSKPAESIARAA